MSTSTSQEVQLLLAAEKRAMERVSEAKKRKAERLKRAKEEAAADLEQFKAERQLSFSKYETDHMGTKDDVARKIEKDTVERLETMQKWLMDTKSKILERLTNEVVSGVDAKLHRNRKVNEPYAA